MRKIILSSLTLILFLFFGCSSDPKLVQVVKEIDGPLRENLTVISDKVPVELVKSVLGGYDQYDISFSVEIEVSNPINISGGYKDGSPFGPTLEYRLLNDLKQPITIGGLRIQSDPDLDGIAKNIAIKGNKFWIRIFQSIDASSESVKLTKDLLKKAAFVQITSSLQGNNEADNSGTSDLSAVDCDQILKDYELFMIKYIEIIKKYKESPSDATILTEYTQILAENASWGSQIESCALNQEYALKFTEIQTKIASALITDANMQAVGNVQKQENRNATSGSDIKYYKIQDADGFSNLRKEPNGIVIRKVYPNEKFEVIGSEGSFKKVKFLDGSIGYIHQSRVFEIKP